MDERTIIIIILVFLTLNLLLSQPSVGVDLLNVEVSDETETHLQRRSESPDDAFHFALHHVPDEHVLYMVAEDFVKEHQSNMN